MLTVYYAIGLPASGKSTWAKAKMAENPGAYVRTNKDLLREMLHNGRWSRDNEKLVLAARDFIIEYALSAGKHVIVDDTGFSEKHQNKIREIAKKHEALFEVVDFTSVPLDECIARDRKRPNGVGYGVIIDMHRQFLQPKIEAAPIDPRLPDAVIIDIDGTLARMNGRGPFEWQRVGEDLPRDEVWSACKGFKAERIVLSGRDECCRAETETWLLRHFSHSGKLFMRPAGDIRKDSIVKGEIYEREINGQFNVLAVFDDRLQIQRYWKSVGLGDRLFRVGMVDEDDF